MNMTKHAAAAALMLLSASSYADTTLGPSTIPANATVVYPTPDSRVDLGPNASPLGLQQVSAMFRKDITVNPDCQGRAAIYSAGEETPLQTVGVAGASVDLTQSKMGSVLFPHSCTANGRYRVTIPEGFWLLDGDTPEYSGAFDLYYEILVPQRISPAEGVADQLKEFRLEFPGYKEARLLDSKKIDFFRLSSSDKYNLSISQGTDDDGSPSNYLLISLDKAISDQGEYSLFVKAGAAEGINYGEDGEETIDKNIEALYRYTVSKIPAPSILPEEGIVECFVPFELTVPEGADFWFVNDRAVSFIYPVEADGSLAPDAAYRLTAKQEGADKIVLTIMEDAKPLSHVTPKPGHYALKLASGLFSGQWGSEFINSAPFVYYYQSIGVPDNPDPDDPDPDNPDPDDPDPDNPDPDNPDNVQMTSAAGNAQDAKGIFTIDGKKMRAPVNPETLPQGIYVIDGRKFVRK